MTPLLHFDIYEIEKCAAGQFTLNNPDLIIKGPYSSYKRKSTSGLGFPFALQEITIVLLVFFITPVFDSSNKTSLTITASVYVSTVFSPFDALQCNGKTKE